MKLLVDAPAYWPTEEIARSKAWLYLASAKHFGIEPQLYGIGAYTYYPGEVPMRLDGQIDYLKRVGGDYTHVLFTDAWDVLFADPLHVIINKYEKFGSPPCLIGGTKQCLNSWPRDKYDQYFDLTKQCRYPTTAMYIAEIPYIIDCFTRMDKSCTHDQTNAFMHGWSEGWFRPEIDYDSVLFQDTEDCAKVVGTRLYNLCSQTMPSMIHISGDYMDPNTGRDSRIIPWAQKLGII
jgi:hypothetical protein